MNTTKNQTKPNQSYQDFLDGKTHLGQKSGFKPLWMPDFLFPFQRTLTTWAIEKGRAAIFADCGLGKGQPEGSLILTPNGFVPNSTLNVGDMVVSSNGIAYPLQAKYIDRTERPA